MSTPKLFEYAILWHPTKEEKENGKKSAIIVNPTIILADDVARVNMAAAMSIPTEYRDNLDQVEIAVRPF